MTRDEVFQEFTRWTGWPNTTGTIHQTHWYDTDAMAEEIVRLRDRLAAVEAERDAMEGMYRHHVGVALDAIAKLNHAQATVSTLQEQLTHQTYTLTAEHQRAERTLAALREPSDKVVEAAWLKTPGNFPVDENDMRAAIRAAVTAAEKEVSGDQ